MKNSKTKSTGAANIRQGDVVLVPVESLPPSVKPIPGKVLQQSEVTGHHHHFKPTAPITIYQDDKSLLDLAIEETERHLTITPNLLKFIEVTEDTLLYHGRGFDETPAKTKTGDHHALKVPRGTYRIDIIREYDYDANEVRTVVD